MGSCRVQTLVHIQDSIRRSRFKVFIVGMQGPQNFEESLGFHTQRKKLKKKKYTSGDRKYKSIIYLQNNTREVKCKCKNLLLQNEMQQLFSDCDLYTCKYTRIFIFILCQNVSFNATQWAFLHLQTLVFGRASHLQKKNLVIAFLIFHSRNYFLRNYEIFSRNYI